MIACAQNLNIWKAFEKTGDVSAIAKKYLITQAEVEQVVADRIDAQTRTDKRKASLKDTVLIEKAHLRAKNRQRVREQAMARFTEYDPPAEMRTCKVPLPLYEVWYVVKSEVHRIECDSLESRKEIMDSVIMEGGNMLFAVNDFTDPRRGNAE